MDNKTKIESTWNILQGELFKLTYKRANRAVRAGFYLEAVSLEESLILNRLEVILLHSAGVRYEYFSVGKALKNIQSHNVPAMDESLWADCQAWVKRRNNLSHHFAQVDLEDGLTWRSRISLARETAVEGIALANRCSKESRKHKQ